jgi:8-oxo-dGTP pyrophosphatase MutT (NUDIX family)
MQAVQLPTVSRKPLIFRGAALGSIADPLVEQMIAHGLPLLLQGVQGMPLELVGEPNSSLAEIATWLRAHGHAAPWRNELIEVATLDGRRIGCVERAVVRNLGIATRAVQLHGAVEGTDQHWLQQRAFDKQTDPGRWDTLVGGLVSDGETTAKTLERETREEAGLCVHQMKGLESCGSFTLRRPVQDGGTHGYMVETLHVLRCVVPATAAPVNQDGEVARFDRFTESQIDAFIERGDVTLEAAIAVALFRNLEI